MFSSLNLLNPKGTIPQNFSLLEFAVLEELGITHTNKQTDSLISYCLYRVISFINTLVTTALVNFVHMFSGKMLNWAGLLKLAGGGLEGTSFPPSDPQTCI